MIAFWRIGWSYALRLPAIRKFRGTGFVISVLPTIRQFSEIQYWASLKYVLLKVGWIEQTRRVGKVCEPLLKADRVTEPRLPLSTLGRDYDMTRIAVRILNVHPTKTTRTPLNVHRRFAHASHALTHTTGLQALPSSVRKPGSQFPYCRQYRHCSMPATIMLPQRAKAARPDRDPLTSDRGSPV
jgi:hypothetical protein